METKEPGEEYSDWVVPTTGSVEQPRTQGKKFSVSPEKFSTDRLEKLREGFDLLRTRNPEVAAVLLYGSMSKGKARETSDIDGDIFIDTELLENGGQKVNRTEISDEQDHKINYYLNDSTAQEYANFLRNYLQENAGLSIEQVQHLRVRPINHEMIDEQIEGLMHYLQEQDEYMALHQKQWDYTLNGEEPPSELGSLKEPRLFYLSGNISALFHLQMGHGVDKYRSYIIDKLKEYGEDGEKVWQAIIERTASMELRGREEKIKFPGTLDEASRIYQGK